MKCLASVLVLLVALAVAACEPVKVVGEHSGQLGTGVVPQEHCPIPSSGEYCPYYSDGGVQP